MPYLPNTPCKHTGCPSVVSGKKYCDKHKDLHKPDDYRESSSKRGYGRKWQKARLGYLKKHPLCVECENEGRITAASVVDHKIPHKMNMVLFWDSENNWQSLCKMHHDRKTATEDGGFGR